MNKETIIEKINEYNLDKEKYIVISGAAMVLLEIKNETSDIDIAVEEEYFNYLIKNYNCTFEKINQYGKEVYFIDDIINFSTTYYDSNTKLINNIRVQTEEEILKLKEKLKREKDNVDIGLIKKKIKKVN